MNARTAPPEPAIAVPVAAPASEPAAKPARSLRKALVMLSVPLLLVAGGAGWWLTGANRESTENAYLHQARISIAPTVGGRVVAVHLHELQHVKAGDLLFQVDPQPYQLAVAQAEAAVSAARLQVEQLKAVLAQAEAQAEGEQARGVRRRGVGELRRAGQRVHHAVRDGLADALERRGGARA